MAKSKKDTKKGKAKDLKVEPDPKKEPARKRWTPKMDEALIALYDSGMPIAEVCKTLSKKFKRPCSVGSVQSRLGSLRAQGAVTKRPAGGNGKAKTSSNGAHLRVLSVDLGPKGRVRVEIEGPIGLHTEAVQDLAEAVGKLMVV